jgi:NAD kinase
MKALLVYKKSKLELLEEKIEQFKPEQNGQKSHEELYLNDPINTKKLREAHDANKQALETVISELEKHHIAYTPIWRGGDDMYQLTKEHDIVIACGGDGTFIDAARYITTDTPIVGVSSNPYHSVGYLCSCIPQTLIDCINNSPKTILPRMEVTYNGTPLRSSIINDVVISKGIASFQRLGMVANSSSNESCPQETLWDTGLLISTGAGSTAYMSNANGKVFDVDSRKIEYAELLVKPAKIGFCDNLKITVQDNDVIAYLDGDYQKLELGFTDTLEFSMNGHPLTMYGNLAEKQKEFLLRKNKD